MSRSSSQSTRYEYYELSNPRSPGVGWDEELRPISLDQIEEAGRSGWRVAHLITELHHGHVGILYALLERSVKED